MTVLRVEFVRGKSVIEKDDAFAPTGLAESKFLLSLDRISYQEDQCYEMSLSLTLSVFLIVHWLF